MATICTTSGSIFWDHAVRHRETRFISSSLEFVSYMITVHAHLLCKILTITFVHQVSTTTELVASAARPPRFNTSLTVNISNFRKTVNISNDTKQ